MRDRKDLTIDFNDETGMEECYLSHTRVIGDRSFTTKRSITDDEEKEESIETKMDDSELENFKNEWEMIKERPKTSISQSVCNFCGNIQEIDEPGILTRCFLIAISFGIISFTILMLNPFN